MRCWWMALLLAGCLGDKTPPELVDLSLTDGTDLRGVGDVTSWAIYRDESDVEARFNRAARDEIKEDCAVGHNPPVRDCRG